MHTIEDQQPDTPDINKLAQKTIDYLYTIDGEIEPELAQAIATLRQIINEEFIARNKLVSSQLIYDLIYQKFRQFYLSKALEAAPKKRDPVTCSAGDLCDRDMCCSGVPYENQAFNEAIDLHREVLVSAFKGKQT